MAKRFNWRGFVSVSMITFFVVIVITGIVLYFSPPGRIAHWTNWRFLGLLKEEWQAVHTIFTFIFTGIAVFHIIYNWKPLLAYLKRKMKEGIQLRTEGILAAAAALVVLVLTIGAVPPFSSVMDIGEMLSESWGDEGGSPPVPHAEEFTIPEFASVVNMEAAEVEQQFTKAGITWNDGETLQQIADANNTTPDELAHVAQQKGNGGASVVQPGIGRGYGRMTIQQIADQEGIRIEEVIVRLQAKGISAKADALLKDVAAGHELNPGEIYTIITGKQLH